MALINPEGNYLKITDISIEQLFIVYEIFEKQTIRLNGLNKFQTAVRSTKYIQDVLGQTDYDITKTLRDNILTKAYQELKQSQEFSEWIDA